MPANSEYDPGNLKGPVIAPNNGTPVPWTYGHYCGAGGSGNPTDPNDAACMAHDAWPVAPVPMLRVPPGPSSTVAEERGWKTH